MSAPAKERDIAVATLLDPTTGKAQILIDVPSRSFAIGLTLQGARDVIGLLLSAIESAAVAEALLRFEAERTGAVRTVLPAPDRVQ